MPDDQPQDIGDLVSELSLVLLGRLLNVLSRMAKVILVHHRNELNVGFERQPKRYHCSWYLGSVLEALWCGRDRWSSSRMSGRAGWLAGAVPVRAAQERPTGQWLSPQTMPACASGVSTFSAISATMSATVHILRLRIIPFPAKILDRIR